MEKLFKIILFSAFILYTSITVINQQMTIRQLELRKAELNTQIVEAKNENKRLQQELKEASSDSYVEKVAREKLNLVKDGDIIYVDVGGASDPLKGAGQ
ncbi:cell division protein FtsL [Calorimonas adulescens]|jgi:cell division protein FtsL|uniref:Cell division protein FtsL n=1 Tax=Calorimonas adulescens TaxID=2606906 RepID=A0A5D8QAD9_9THEO|nr:cell division protein FtsL [Calorimonas adulescens]TZE81099.1 cell division protein FtsL [Calorimonas adulescens]